MRLPRPAAAGLAMTKMANFIKFIKFSLACSLKIHKIQGKIYKILLANKPKKSIKFKALKEHFLLGGFSFPFLSLCFHNQAQKVLNCF